MNAIKANELVKGMAVPAPHGQPIDAHEISKVVWPQFCRWFSETFRGLETSVERDEGKDHRAVECPNCTLDRLATTVLANGVLAVSINVSIDGKKRVFEVPGPQWLRLHCDAAGFPTILETGYEGGKLVLRFTGVTTGIPVFSANSWGE